MSDQNKNPSTAPIATPAPATTPGTDSAKPVEHKAVDPKSAEVSKS